MTTKWLSTIEACQVLGVSQSTLRRRIDKGEIESKLEDGRRLVLVTTDEDMVTTAPESELTTELRSQVDHLKEQFESLHNQLSGKDKQIEKLQGQLERANEALAEASHRHDTVVMQMTRLIEYHQQPFWRRLFSRKALPPPEQIMDMEPGGDQDNE